MSDWKPTPLHEALGNKKPSDNTLHFWRIFAAVALIAVCVLGVLNSCRNRYRPYEDIILDTWTGNVYPIEDKIITNN